jgi:hypothetical protein
VSATVRLHCTVLRLQINPKHFNLLTIGTVINEMSDPGSGNPSTVTVGFNPTTSTGDMVSVKMGRMIVRRPLQCTLLGPYLDISLFPEGLVRQAGRLSIRWRR